MKSISETDRRKPVKRFQWPRFIHASCSALASRPAALSPSRAPRQGVVGNPVHPSSHPVPNRKKYPNRAAIAERYPMPGGS